MMPCAQLRRLLAFALLIGVAPPAAEAVDTFTYRRPITIDASRVIGSTNHSNFPVLVSIGPDTNLRAAVYGGHVEHVNGFDIVFTASDGVTELDFEIEHYDAGTGVLLAWVRVPSLSFNTDTTLYMYYGSSTVLAPGETTDAVWDSGFVGVWHLSENGNGAPNEYEDSSLYGNHGQGGEGDPRFLPKRVAGRVGYGQYFDRTYDTGTAFVGAGTTTVFFSGAALPGNVQAGDQISIDPGGPNEETFTLASRDSATQVTVTTPAASSHGGEGYILFDEDPQGDLIDAGNRSSLDITGDSVTLEAWVWHDVTFEINRLRGIVNHQGWNQGYRILFPWDSSAIQFQVTGVTDSLKSTTSIPPQSWHHVVATYDGAMMRIFIDGVEDASQARTGDILSVPPLQNHVTIGHGDQPKGQVWSYPWEGQLDEVRISHVARSADWIATEYNNQSAPASFHSVGSEEPGSFPLSTFTENFRSIGTNGGVLYATGSATVSLGSTNAVLGSGASLPTHVGVGDELVVDPGGANEETFFIRSRTSTTEIAVHSAASTAHVAESYAIRRAYNSLQGWEGARQGDLVGENRREVGVAYNDGPFTSGLVVDGSTTDPLRFLELTVADGQRHTGIAGTGVLLDPSVGGNAITVIDDYTRVTWFEVTGWTGDSAEGVRIDADHAWFENLIVHDGYDAVGSDNADGFYMAGNGGDWTATIRNTMVYNVGRAGIYMRNWTGSNTLVFDLENVTLFNCGSPTAGEPEAAGGVSVREGATARSTINALNVLSVGNFDADSDGDADFNLDDNGAGVPSWGLSSFNVSSDLSAPGLYSFTSIPPSTELVNVTPGSENLHLSAGATAINAGTDLSARFDGDIDGTFRGSPWDVGADEMGGPAGVASLSSNASQNFTVADPSTLAETLTVTESATSASITGADDIRLRIPATFNMIWDPSVSSVIPGGTAAGKVSSTVKAYEDFGRTVVLDVTSDFSAGEQLTVDGLRFSNFVAPSPANFLSLEVFNDDVPVAFDDKTIAIGATSGVNLSSEADQVFTVLAPATQAARLFVSEGTTPAIAPGTDIRVRVPAGFNMIWDASLSSPVIGGSASGKVNPAVSYESSDRTLRIVVTTAFVPGDYISVSGLAFKSFTGVSPADNLELDVVADTDTDDKTVQIELAADIDFLAATSTTNQVLLQWVHTPGQCNFVRILARDDGMFPTGPADAGARVVAVSHPCAGPGVKNGFPDLGVVNDIIYRYAVYVDYGGGFTPGNKVIARPFNTGAGQVKWAYSTGATAMAPPGLRFDPGNSYVYAVSNDSIVHSVRGGEPGGDWPANWTPLRLGAPAQARPPVVPFLVGSAVNGAAFLGSQDGKVYVVDADTGTLVWDRLIANVVQAAPSGNFKGFDLSAYDYVFAGTRNSVGQNALESLDVNGGSPVWGFKNEGPQNGDDKDIGIISGSVSVDYTNQLVYFASREHASGSANSVWCVDFTTTPPQLLWARAVGNIDGSPILHEGVVYVGTNAGIVYALDAVSGSVNWFRALGDGPVKGFIFPRFDTNELLLSTSTKVWSLRDNGTTSAITPNWPVTTIASPSIPVQVPGMPEVLVGSSDGRLYQMDAVNPLPLKSVTLGDGTAAVGVPTADTREMMIYVGTDAGIIYGVRFPLP